MNTNIIIGSQKILIILIKYTLLIVSTSYLSFLADPTLYIQVR